MAAELTLPTGSAQFVVKGSHVYATTGSYPLVVYLTGPDGTSLSLQVTSTSVSAMPSGLPGTVPAAGSQEPLAEVVFSTGGASSISSYALAGFAPNPVALFSAQVNTQPDLNAADFHAQVNWGDSSQWFSANVVSITASQEFKVQGSHTYAQAGMYPIVVYITGPDGTSVSRGTSTADVTPCPTGMPVQPPGTFLKSAAVQGPGVDRPGSVSVYDLAGSQLNLNANTYIVSHGLGGSACRFIALAVSILECDPTANVLMVDWSDEAYRPLPLIGLSNPIPVGKNVNPTGDALAAILEMLPGFDPSKTVYIGESFGDYLNNWAARDIFLMTGVKSGKILAFDPAANFTIPFFNINIPYAPPDLTQYFNTSVAAYTNSFFDYKKIKANANLPVPDQPSGWVQQHTFGVQWLAKELQGGDCSLLNLGYVPQQLGDAPPPAPLTDYIPELYNLLLDRPGDPAGVDYWTNLLATNAASPSQVVSQFESSPEYLAATVDRAFAAILGRESTPGETSAWSNFLASGATMEQLEAALLGSGEFVQGLGNGGTDGFLSALYELVLGRSIDPQGKTSWEQAIANGATNTQVALAVLQSPESKSDLVQGVYLEYLNRAPNSAELNSWVAALEQGTPDQQFTAAVLGSNEFDSKLRPDRLGVVAGIFSQSAEYDSRFVNATYERFLGRGADASALPAWVALMQQGVADEQIEAMIASSPEFIQDSGGLGSGWVQALYKDFLQRSADPGGLQSWLAQLNKLSPEQIAYAFATSAEYESIVVQNDYQNYLGRKADPAELASWVTLLTNGRLTREIVVSSVLSSSEYYYSPTRGQGSRSAWVTSAYQDLFGRSPAQGELISWVGQLYP
jgi:hypothetical protein